MRYMIAHLIRGDGKQYHENLSRAIASAYRLRPVTATIDPHLTIKAPFDALSTDIQEIEQRIMKFVRTQSPQSYTLKGFGRFGDRVIFMHVHEAGSISTYIQELREELRQIPWIEFKPHEQDALLHATLCYPRDAEQTQEIVDKLTQGDKGKEFLCLFDTIALLRKNGERWETYKEYHLGGVNDVLSFSI